MDNAATNKAATSSFLCGSDSISFCILAQVNSLTLSHLFILQEAGIIFEWQWKQSSLWPTPQVGHW